MPWEVSGNFKRINDDYEGVNVWAQDQAAGIKIIASRHDTHDEDIATGIENCLHTGGYNEMLADLAMGGFKVTGMDAGTTTGDAVEYDQFQLLAADVAQNAADIAAVVTTDPDNIISAMSWNGATLTLTRANGNFTATIAKLNTIKSNGVIRHLGAAITPAASVTVNPANGNRFTLQNDQAGGIAITITKPTGADSDLGETYQVEGQVIIENDAATPGALSLVGVAAADIIGAPSAATSVSQILSYMIMRFAGDSYIEKYIWTTP